MLNLVISKIDSALQQDSEKQYKNIIHQFDSFYFHCQWDFLQELLQIKK